VSKALGVLRMLPVLQRLGDAYDFYFSSFSLVSCFLLVTRLFRYDTYSKT